LPLMGFPPPSLVPQTDPEEAPKSRCVPRHHRGFFHFRTRRGLCLAFSSVGSLAMLLATRRAKIAQPAKRTATEAAVPLLQPTVFQPLAYAAFL
jgi:hypothetical protein